jgi:hypothetical protein
MKQRIWFFAALLAAVIPSPVNAQQGGCWLVYDGVDDQVRIPNSGTFPVFEYTITAWVKTTQSTSTRAILSRGEDPMTDVLPWGFGLLSDGTVYLQLESAANVSPPVYSGTTSVNDGSWHHVAVTRALNGDAEIYVDGLPDASHSNTLITQDGNQTMGMGFTFQEAGSGPGIKPPALFFDGSLDEITLWTAPLSAVDVAAIKQNGLPTSTTGLQAHWELDEGSGQTATDSTSGFIGTLGTTTNADLSDPLWECAPPVPALGPSGLAALTLALLLTTGHAALSVGRRRTAARSR